MQSQLLGMSAETENRMLVYTMYSTGCHYLPYESSKYINSGIDQIESDSHKVICGGANNV